MGRSINLRPILPPASFYHRRSNRHYEIDGDSLRRYQLNSANEKVNILEKRVDAAIGSGRHAITYINRTAQGRWLELPISWYTRTGSYSMSPGYDRADHLDFRREVSGSCLFCHSGRPEPAPIDCDRCHGAVAVHLKSPRSGTILNPKNLPAQRQLEICLQCHLETASRGIQDHLLAPGRALWSFQPGEPLSSWKMYFDRTDSAASDRFEFNHAGYRLLASACYLKSGGKLTCTTCHDPHSGKVRANACSQCHQTPHESEGASRTGSCVSCHMPRRVPEDAVHTAVTDHRITRRPTFSNPITEVHTPYSGAIASYYGHADELSLALANIKAGADVLKLYRLHLQRSPDDVGTLAALGKELLRRSQAIDAMAAFERALKVNPMHTDSRTLLGVALAVLGRHDESIAQLRRAVRDNPDHSLSWFNLGVTLAASGRTDEATAAYSEAVRLQPDFAEARQRRAVLLNRQKAKQ